mmetsp:Transcript_15098/g.17735  ORF Transcript_15098/g.17735 Transcript_15098/m.17735 type:complete len:984 (+) Transcript_15098:153-3104(+)
MAGDTDIGPGCITIQSGVEGIESGSYIYSSSINNINADIYPFNNIRSEMESTECKGEGSDADSDLHSDLDSDSDVSANEISIGNIRVRGEDETEDRVTKGRFRTDSEIERNRRVSSLITISNLYKDAYFSSSSTITKTLNSKGRSTDPVTADEKLKDNGNANASTYSSMSRHVEIMEVPSADGLQVEAEPKLTANASNKNKKHCSTNIHNNVDVDISFDFSSNSNRNSSYKNDNENENEAVYLNRSYQDELQLAGKFLLPVTSNPIEIQVENTKITMNPKDNQTKSMEESVKVNSEKELKSDSVFVRRELPLHLAFNNDKQPNPGNEISTIKDEHYMNLVKLLQTSLDPYVKFSGERVKTTTVHKSSKYEIDDDELVGMPTKTKFPQSEQWGIHIDNDAVEAEQGNVRLSIPPTSVYEMERKVEKMERELEKATMTIKELENNFKRKNADNTNINQSKVDVGNINTNQSKVDVDSININQSKVDIESKLLRLEFVDREANLEKVRCRANDLNSSGLSALLKQQSDDASENNHDPNKNSLRNVSKNVLGKDIKSANLPSNANAMNSDILYKLELEKYRLKEAQNRVRLAQDKSTLSMNRALEQLATLEKARHEAESRAALLEVDIEKANENITRYSAAPYDNNNNLGRNLGINHASEQDIPKPVEKNMTTKSKDDQVGIANNESIKKAVTNLHEHAEVLTNARPPNPPQKIKIRSKANDLTSTQLSALLQPDREAKNVKKLNNNRKTQSALNIHSELIDDKPKTEGSSPTVKLIEHKAATCFATDNFTTEQTILPNQVELKPDIKKARRMITDLPLETSTIEQLIFPKQNRIQTASLVREVGPPFATVDTIIKKQEFVPKQSAPKSDTLKTEIAPFSSVVSKENRINIPMQNGRKSDTRTREAAAPFATDASTKNIQAVFSILERKLLILNMEKSECDSKLSKLFNKNERTIQAIKEKSRLEKKLVDLEKEISNIRIALRSQPK